MAAGGAAVLSAAVADPYSPPRRPPLPLMVVVAGGARGPRVPEIAPASVAPPLLIRRRGLVGGAAREAIHR
jgi:hypothetical protein